MNKEEALKYCYEHKDEFISDMYKDGEDGVRQFDCLILVLEEDTITPDELADYGMEY